VRLLPRPDGSLRVRLDPEEAGLLDQLTGQLIDLLQSHSRTALDPDPVLASLEVGGSFLAPDDPALSRLFPDAYEDEDDAAQFRSVTEQGLLNRKLQDAVDVSAALGLGGTLDAHLNDELEQRFAESQRDPLTPPPSAPDPVEVIISPDDLPAWVRTLTALRLAISARIGLEADADHAVLLDDEETRGTVLVFDWLGAILDSLLRVGMAQ